MLNFDKYRDELIEEMKCRKENLDDCENDSYRGVEIYFKSIKEVKKRHGGGSSVLYGDVVEWLFSEYEPPRLQNGDGLKPGDWIMVRDCGGGCWVKRQFLFYHNGIFYCELVDSSIGNGEYVAWKQARLPEEDE